MLTLNKALIVNLRDHSINASFASRMLHTQFCAEDFLRVPVTVRGVAVDLGNE
jgi:hypothetical protein